MKSILVLSAATLLAGGIVHAGDGVIARMDADSVVRVTSADGRAEYAKVAFDLPVGAGWKVLARHGAGMKAVYSWVVVGDGLTVPWYVLASDGERTLGIGVKVRPRNSAGARSKRARSCGASPDRAKARFPRGAGCAGSCARIHACRKVRS